MHRGVTRFLPQARGHGRAQDSLGTKVKTRLQRNPAFKKPSLKIGTFPRSRRGAEGCRNLRVTFGTRKPLQPPAPLLLKAVSGRGYATAWRFYRLPHPGKPSKHAPRARTRSDGSGYALRFTLRAFSVMPSGRAPLRLKATGESGVR